MQRDIIQIDEEKCNGCSICISACHEGAPALVNGKARLLSEIYCDGLGACLPECPTGAIQIIRREAAEFTQPAPGSQADLAGKAAPTAPAAPKAEEPLACGCPGSHAKVLRAGHDAAHAHHHMVGRAEQAAPCQSAEPPVEQPVSELRQWPVQIKLVPVQAPYLDNARLLIAADCAAYSHARFHEDYMKGRITLIGCPKLDAVNYAEKLTEIFRQNTIKNILVVRMEVPCCGGLEHAVMQAMQASGKMVPWQVVTLGTDGTVLAD